MNHGSDHDSDVDTRFVIQATRRLRWLPWQQFLRAYENRVSICARARGRIPGQRVAHGSIDRELSNHIVFIEIWHQIQPTKPSNLSPKLWPLNSDSIPLSFTRFAHKRALTRPRTVSWRSVERVCGWVSTPPVTHLSRCAARHSTRHHSRRCDWWQYNAWKSHWCQIKNNHNQIKIN
jgi:hypothetical protein